MLQSDSHRAPKLPESEFLYVADRIQGDLVCTICGQFICRGTEYHDGGDYTTTEAYRAHRCNAKVSSRQPSQEEIEGHARVHMVKFRQANPAAGFNEQMIEYKNFTSQFYPKQL